MVSLLLGNSGPALTCGLVCPLPGDPARLQMICPLLGSRLRPLPTEPLLLCPASQSSLVPGGLLRPLPNRLACSPLAAPLLRPLPCDPLRS
jgi:hypothetical protein